jgi:hypothetical protein
LIVARQLEDIMFEQQMEMEKKSSSIIPLLMIVALVVAIAGVAIYLVLWSRTTLATAEATPIVTAALQAQGPETLSFETGPVKDQYSPDPRYRLLEKAGYVRIGKAASGKTPITLTPQGQAWLAAIPGVKENKTGDGTEQHVVQNTVQNTVQYTVPLAERRLIKIGKITMISPSKAAVEYSWKWETTNAGDLLDAAGPAVKAFNTWDRSTLIDKFGAAFYHGDPRQVTILLSKQDKGWGITRE